MAEHDQNNDEFNFTELDGFDNDMMEGADPALSNESASLTQKTEQSKDIKRNAIVAVVIIVFIMLVYKVGGYLFSSKNSDISKNSIPPLAQVSPQTPPVTVEPQVQASIEAPTPVTQQPTPSLLSEHYADLTKKVAAIDLSQQNMRSEVNNVGQQVGAVNNNISNLNNEIANLNQVIKNLSQQLAKQTEEINVLMVRTQQKPVLKKTVKASTPPLLFNIQAVIPGRAWLIGSNGSTLTVREGTKIAGYGIVKLIDPLQGRVVTSSGQVIRFSQEDS